MFKLVKCLQNRWCCKAAAARAAYIEGYLRCTVFYQGEDGAGLCQTEQKLLFTKQLEVPEFSFTSWMAMVEGRLNTQLPAVKPGTASRCGEPMVLWLLSIHRINRNRITALADGGIEQKLQTLNGVQAVYRGAGAGHWEGELVFAKAARSHSGYYRQRRRAGGKAAGGQGSGQGRGTCSMRLAREGESSLVKSGGIPAVQSGGDLKA